MILPTGASALAAEETATVIRREDAVRELRELKPEQVFDGPTRRMLEERFAWMYPYAGREQIPVEVSVSAIEHHLYDAAEAEDETPPVMQLVPEAEREESEPLVPAFIREAERKETRPAAEWTEAVEEKIRPDARTQPAGASRGKRDRPGKTRHRKRRRPGKARRGKRERLRRAAWRRALRPRRRSAAPSAVLPIIM